MITALVFWISAKYHADGDLVYILTGFMDLIIFVGVFDLLGC